MTRIIVVGAGLAGSAAAWRLAQGGHDVTVLERTSPANEYGSSHGSARIFRFAYPERFYTELVVKSASGWSELEAAHGSPLITSTGAVDYGSSRNPEKLAEILAASGVSHELLTASEARQRWNFAFDTAVLWQPGAGVIDAEQSVEAMLAQAQMLGAEVRGDTTVTQVLATSSGYRVATATGEFFEAEQVVIAAGGWLPDLLGDLALPSSFLQAFPALEVRQEQAFHFEYRDREVEWPTFIHKTDEIQVYGLPGGRDADFRGQKVAEYNGGKSIRSAAQHDRQVDPANRRRVVEYVERYLPGLVPEPYAETTCLFTNTPNEDFVIDRVDGITILSPCSGHGAKFAPLIGELAAALVAGESVPSRFRPGLRAAI
ncbi:FAD-dependent oxidoreductase [Salinibacterium sp. SWN1162]|uniref:FAD-dependent oxidoreductase n=1 Tax=Salinibacterium sp. SWN1162 TaxID=2792053 RepID=UPI0018CFA134|nr:FAD-dependent oxidoreductase [Salinibacterium sp. SWN1162]MBH0008281.1 FAD-dependent oxidoreductase [Salinibacterium sp. SWN1162]